MELYAGIKFLFIDIHFNKYFSLSLYSLYCFNIVP